MLPVSLFLLLGLDFTLCKLGLDLVVRGDRTCQKGVLQDFWHFDSFILVKAQHLCYEILENIRKLNREFVLVKFPKVVRVAFRYILVRRVAVGRGVFKGLRLRHQAKEYDPEAKHICSSSIVQLARRHLGRLEKRRSTISTHQSVRVLVVMLHAEGPAFE